MYFLFVLTLLLWSNIMCYVKPHIITPTTTELSNRTTPSLYCPEVPCETGSICTTDSEHVHPYCKLETTPIATTESKTTTECPQVICPPNSRYAMDLETNCTICVITTIPNLTTERKAGSRQE